MLSGHKLSLQGIALKLLIVSSVVFVVAVLTSSQALAAGCVSDENMCPSSTLGPLGDYFLENNLFADDLNSSEERNIIVEGNRHCALSNITEVNSVWSHAGGWVFNVCFDGYVADKSPSGLLAYGGAARCCPESHPNLILQPQGIHLTYDLLCCPDPNDSIVSDSDGKCYRPDNSSVPAEQDRDLSSIWGLEGSNHLIETETLWWCGGGGNCRVLNGDRMNPAETFESESACEANGAYCINNNELDPNDATRRCVDGNLVDASAPIDPDAGELSKGCDNIPEENAEERTQCRACVARNLDEADEGFFVWNALGCWDVSLNGIVTRLFQIGIGIIGGVMILRFIQAAIMMQTDNPEQIREAKEIVSSAIIALIVLLGAVVILRFLGINVLGILPLDFLQ
ncbi:MAG: hypothetical protein TR69_WS6001000811 [candidate division WS6 bacterium OLB20]|uniref:Uncharacterized protein n=1 Tax=candidate division WS6 bacterium OLB20 TaxID=1617426 RepID=A0A136LYP7_9BACT|nr:MAG: hypothetical protein TR69_WS6001000811 [candidate division WS6 bacterium OLB20]